MNPWPPLKKLIKAFAFILSLPFMIIALVLQGFWMLLAGFVSVAATLLALGAVAVAVSGIAAVPWFLYHKSKSNDRHRSHVVVQLRDGRVLHRRKFSFVGPDGRTVHLGDDEANAMAIVVDDEFQAEVADPREIDDFDVLVPPVAVVQELNADEDALSMETRHTREPAEESGSAAPAPPSLPDATRPRPDWVDEILGSDITGNRIVVKGDQCESAEACEAAYRDAIDNTLCDYVRGRAEICLSDLRIAKMPWHEVTVQRIAQSLRIQPKDEYLDIHDTDFDGRPLRTYLKYGLLEISPAIRDHVDGEITRWTRSFQAASYWGILLSAVAGLYLFVKVDLPGRIARRWGRHASASRAVST